MNNELERASVIQGTISALTRKGWGKLRKTSFTIASPSVEIRTENLPNTNLKRCCYSNSFGMYGCYQVSKQYSLVWVFRKRLLIQDRWRDRHLFSGQERAPHSLISKFVSTVFKFRFTPCRKHTICVLQRLTGWYYFGKNSCLLWESYETDKHSARANCKVVFWLKQVVSIITTVL
jgi:hypothetical protein